MKQNKSEKVVEFEKKMAGTVITILDFVSLFCLLLIVIAMFLPICKVEIIGESVGLLK